MWSLIPVRSFLLESSDSQPIADILTILNSCVLVGRIFAHSIIWGRRSPVEDKQAHFAAVSKHLFKRELSGSRLLDIFTSKRVCSPLVI
jgi:hypothetical protein